MKNTLTRTLALMMALLLALSVCAFADETDVTATMPGETDVTTIMPGEIVETVEPAAEDLIDDVDETPAEAEGELEMEPVEVEEELVVEDAPEIVTDEAMYGAPTDEDHGISIDQIPVLNNNPLPVQIGNYQIFPEGTETDIDVDKQFQNYFDNPIQKGDVTLTIGDNNHYTLTLNNAEIQVGYGYGIHFNQIGGKLTIKVLPMSRTILIKQGEAEDKE